MADFNQKISSQEKEIIGDWIFMDGEIVDDINSKRIEYLIDNELTEILVHENGWFRLFLDRVDNRFWELQYLQAELHGGGPKSLVVLDKTEVLRKYPDFR